MASHADPLHVAEIVGYLRSALAPHPELANLDVGIVCGSGLSGLSAAIEAPVAIPYSSIPHFPRSTVAGHGTELVFGRLGGKTVVAARGRFHFYEGHGTATLGILPRVFAALGAKVVVVTNAAGGVNPNFNVGDVMIITDHINLPGMSGIHPLVGPNDARYGPRFPAVTNTYLPALQEVTKAVAGELGLSQYVRNGVYVMVSGPSYETRHEIAALRSLGADAVGMSTVPEVVVAAHCGMAVLGLSLITNKCVAPGDATTPPTHEEVLSVTDARAHDLQKLVATLVGRLDTASLPAPAAAAAFATVTSSSSSSSAAATGGGAQEMVTCPGTGKQYPKSAVSPHGHGSGHHCHHGAAGGAASKCPYTRTMAMLRCPPILAVTAGLVGAATVLAVQAALARRK